jgi:hypothetical protein
MGTEILSYLPLNQISSSRRCCQQFHGLVAQLEKHYAEPRIATYIIRLQNIIDTRENTRMPTDADTLLASLRIWTSTRRSIPDVKGSQRSLDKWFSYLAGDQLKNKSPPRAHFETWSLVAVEAVKLQLEADSVRESLEQTHDSHAGNMSAVDACPLWDRFQLFLGKIENVPLDQA